MSAQPAQDQTRDFYTLKPKGVFIDPRVHARLKAYVGEHGGSMQQATESAVNKWLQERGEDRIGR